MIALSKANVIRRIALFTLLFLGLSACGGSGGSSPAPSPAPSPSPSPSPTPAPSPSPSPMTFYQRVDDDAAIEAARFLIQASFGPTQESIENLVDNDFSGWIDTQIALPQTRQLPRLDARITASGLDPLDKSDVEHAYLKDLHRSDIWWDTIIHGDDQLRQRITFALSQIFVISNVSDTLFHDARGIASYHDMLASHAFGNFRDLLEDVTLHPMMGEYLSMVRNEKADPIRNIRPDENYARELMQLFSIGLVMLNQDGTEQLDQNNQSIPTYDQEIIKAFARVFTGWMYGNAPFWYWFEWQSSSETIPMKAFPAFHDTEAKTLLNGTVLPADQSAEEDLDGALDNIFAHQNVAPFISKQLIQRLITSNPSPAYVARVAAIFNDNGNGEKGDLAAVVRATLLDTEARSGYEDVPTTFGKLKEPVLKVAHVWRAFGAEGTPTLDENNTQSVTPVIRFYGSNRELGQRPYGSPSVFNFYRPEFGQTGPISAANIVSPEFQILDENHITSATNRLAATAYSDAERVDRPDNFNAIWDVGFINLDYQREKALAVSSQNLVDRLNLLLMTGTMSDAMETVLLDYIEFIPPLNDDLINLRVAETVHMIIVSPEFAVQR